jgi:hypothetical protein
MAFRRTYHYIILAFAAMLVFGCIEEIEFETETFESALVIEATITNEMGVQEIVLSRTYRFEEDGPVPEPGANVRVLSNGASIGFTEVEPGVYRSDSPFAAQSNIDYQLKITTSNGRSYSSTTTQLTSITQIDNVYAMRENNDDGINGMSIYLNSFDPSGNSKYYRYEYEETYKIVAPRYVSEDLYVYEPDSCLVELVDRPLEQRVCYNTENSINLNLVNTNGFSEDRVSNHLIRFISSENYIISYRYSILVRQYIQSREAYTYFETLNEFNGEGSLFSQTQPGFFNGNISSDSNSNEKVIGFFDVSSVSSERIYFNYEDFYSGEPLPPYASPCSEAAPAQFSLGGCGPLIIDLLGNKVKYLGLNDPPGPQEGPYLVVPRPCGDCTALGSSTVPDFWEE